MIDYISITAEAVVDMTDMERSEIEAKIKSELMNGLAKKINDNAKDMADKGYINYETYLYRNRDRLSTRAGINLISDKELARLKDIEQEFERYKKLKEKKHKEFFKKLDDKGVE